MLHIALLRAMVCVSLWVRDAGPGFFIIGGVEPYGSRIDRGQEIYDLNLAT